jgi:hypothetical protein
MARSTLDMSNSWRWPAIGTLLAIACTTALNAVGLSNLGREEDRTRNVR